MHPVSVALMLCDKLLTCQVSAKTRRDESDKLLPHLKAPAVGDTLLADIDELHGELQLPPLRPVGRIHRHQERVQDALNILRMLMLRHLQEHYLLI